MRTCHKTFLVPLLLVSTFQLGCKKEYLSDHVKDGHPETFGLWEVGFESIKVKDSHRNNRKLKIAIWYPVDDQDIGDGLLTTYPLMLGLGPAALIALKNSPVSKIGGRKLIVFSHGYGGINSQSSALMENLASHGFIVAAPEHRGNAQGSGNDSFDEAAAHRVPDVSFVIDVMFDLYSDRLDLSGVGVVGHSFGGMTSVGMATGWAGAAPDPRVTAVLPVSAVIDKDLQSDHREGPNAGFTQEQMSRIEIPIMMMGGTGDVNVFIENNQLAFEQVSSDTVYRTDILGANHTHFANVCDLGNFLIENNISKNLWKIIGAKKLIDPYNDTCTGDAFSIEESVRLQNLYTTAFFKRHLQDQIEYDAYLTEDFADSEPNIRFFRRH